MSLTETALEAFERAIRTGDVLCGTDALRLIAEVRLLQKLVGKPWVDIKIDAPTLERISLEGIEALQSLNRELDGKNLLLTVERDNLRKMLEDANQREQLQLSTLKGIKDSGLAYLCAECGGFAYAPMSSLDSGTTFTCGTCVGKTIVSLETVERYCTQSAAHKAREDRFTKLETLRIKVILLLSLPKPCENDLKALRDALEAVDPKPIPMCAPDPLHDLFPPGTGGGC